MTGLDLIDTMHRVDYDDLLQGGQNYQAGPALFGSVVSLASATTKPPLERWVAFIVSKTFFVTDSTAWVCCV